MAVKCSVCSSKASYQCNTCGSMLCKKCALDFGGRGVFSGLKDVRCPRCGNKGFSST